MADCLTILKPTNPTPNNDFENNRIVFVWDDNNTTEEFYRVQRSTDGGNTWVTLGNRPPNINWWFDEDVNFGSQYCYRVAAGQLTGGECLGEWSDSECIRYEAAPWCSLESGYTVVNNTDCSLTTGKIIINDYDVYKNFYDFVCYQAVGSVPNGWYWIPKGTPNSSGEIVNLFVNWHRIVATPKTNLLRDSCDIKFIKVDVNGSNITLTGQTISDAICGSFNQQDGRAISQFDLGITGKPIFANVYADKGNQTFESKSEYQFISGDSNTLVISDLSAGDYYVVVNQEDNGCLEIFSFTIKSDKLLSVPNIKEIYVTEWFEGFDWNYWSTENDADYFGGLDTLKFQSTKIKEFTSTGLTWYFIPVDDVNVSFNQALSRQVQGFIFTDQLTVGIPYNDEEKWKALTNLLTKKYVVVFKDNNDYWWTFGFQRGADVSDYTFSSALGGFTFSFVTQSENKILTSIDENYVENNIK